MTSFDEVFDAMEIGGEQYEEHYPLGEDRELILRRVMGMTPADECQECGHDTLIVQKDSRQAVCPRCGSMSAQMGLKTQLEFNL